MQINPRTYYSASQAAKFLSVAVTTVKDYCRAGKTAGVSVDAIQVGPKKEWKIRGQTLKDIKAAWKMDS